MGYVSKFTGGEIDSLLSEIKYKIENKIFEGLQGQIDDIQEILKHVDSTAHLTFSPLEDGLVVSLSRSDSEYSIDGGEWIALAASENTPEINVGQKISFRAHAIPVAAPDPIEENSEKGGIGTFTFNKLVAASGTPMSLLYGDDTNTPTAIAWAFANLFRGCSTLVSAPELTATELNEYCYYRMFQGCTNLLKAPELPALVLAKSCYFSMFDGCTKLTCTPKLPAVELAENCYYCMFYNCTNITTATELPANELKHSCYYGMFFGCTGLTEGVKLPAKILAPYCYAFMFQSCVSLTNAPELPAEVMSDYCYNAMFNGCTKLKTAPQLPAMTLAPYCYAFMFQNCTGLKYTDTLPAMELPAACYFAMFSLCTSLEKAPDLPATDLGTNTMCYVSMFQGCSKLNHVKALFKTNANPAMTTAIWLEGVAPSGTFVKHEEANWSESSSSGVPTDWTIEYNFEYNVE